MKKIHLSKNNWRKLCRIRTNQNFTTLSQSVDYLFDHQLVLKGQNQHELQQLNDESFPEEKTDIVEHLPDSNVISKGENVVDIPAVDQGQLLHILSSRTWDQISQIKKDRGFDSFSRVIDHLLDAYNLMRQEKVQGKVEGMDILQEIHDHIEKIKPLRKIEEEPVVEVLSMVDISSPISENHIDDTCTTEWLCCPVCYSIKPLIVELDPDGNPLKKHEDGIEYKMVNGVLQRRFSGPGDDYLPFQIQTGGKVIVEDSMAISTLRRLNKKMFDDFTDVLKAVTFKFVGGWW